MTTLAGIEIQVGIDGLAMAESRQGTPIALTREEVYKALAANPYGKPQTAKTWKDVDPALPAIAIASTARRPPAGRATRSTNSSWRRVATPTPR